MLSAICFNLDQSKTLSSGNGLIHLIPIYVDYAKFTMFSKLSAATVYKEPIPPIQHLHCLSSLSLWMERNLVFDQVFTEHLVISIFSRSNNAYYPSQNKFQ